MLTDLCHFFSSLSLLWKCICCLGRKHARGMGKHAFVYISGSIHVLTLPYEYTHNLQAHECTHTHTQQNQDSDASLSGPMNVVIVPHWFLINLSPVLDSLTLHLSGPMVSRTTSRLYWPPPLRLLHIYSSPVVGKPRYYISPH